MAELRGCIDWVILLAQLSKISYNITW